MAERQWRQIIGYVVLIAAAGVTYYVAQTGVDAHRAALPVKQYLECVQRISNFDWSQVPVEAPPASEVCGERALRQRLED